MSWIILPVAILCLIQGQSFFKRREDVLKEKLEEIFKSEYKDPIIEEIELPDFFSGLKYLSVFDRSQLAEDPLIPSKWIVTRSMKKYRLTLSPRDVSLILTEIKYSPSSPEEALAATRIIAQWICDHGQLISGINSAPWQEMINVSELSFDQVQEPVITKKDSIYKVVCFVYQPKVKTFGLDIIPFETIYRLTCEFDKGSYRIEKELIEASYRKK